jgi:UDP-GlcNAc3NAcA epimerase
MPVHPHTYKKIIEYGLDISFIALSPIGYPQMKKLQQDCAYIITDSGGTSREAYFMKKRSIIVMDKPFWPEIIKAGCGLQSDTDAIVKKSLLLNSLKPGFNTAIFGNGNAAKNIHQHLTAYFKNK